MTMNLEIVNILGAQHRLTSQVLRLLFALYLITAATGGPHLLRKLSPLYVPTRYT